MGRKKPYVPKPFESSRGSKDISAPIYASMVQSSAWLKLSNNARVLYMYMKLQKYGAKDIPGWDELCFYFNASMYTEVYKLYTNRTQFRKDRQQLIDNGFIEIMEDGTLTRTKNIYRFSDKWQTLT